MAVPESGVESSSDGDDPDGQAERQGAEDLFGAC